MSTATRPHAPARRSTGGKAKQQKKSSLPIVPLALAFVAVAAALAVLLTNGGSDPREAAAIEARQYGAVAVSGDALPPLAGAVEGSDAAVGKTAPTLSGTSFDSAAVSIPAASEPTLVVFGAHWCPYCQREIPRVVDWMAAGNATGIQVIAVSTGADPKAPNWTPEAWFEREQWAAPILVDDSEDSAAKAFGVDGYPFFTLLDARGEVVWRGSGEIGMDVLDRVVGAVR